MGIIKGIEQQFDEGYKPVFYTDFPDLWKTKKPCEDAMEIVIIRGTAIVPEPVEVVKKFRIPKE